MLYRVLITQPENPLSGVLHRAFDRAGFIELLSLPGSVDWSSETAVSDLLEAIQPDAVINVCGWSDDGSAATQENLVSPAATLAQQCAQRDLVLIQPSSYRVFKGDKSGFTESDGVHPRDSVGQLYVQVEQHAAQVSRHIILRLSWVVGWQGVNLLTKILNPLTSGGTAEIVSERRGSPVSTDDIGRVVSAMVKQISCGSSNWGVFHYGAADVCTEIELARYIAKRVDGKIEIKGQIQEVTTGATLEPLSAALGYRRLMDSFGVQPRKWKQGVSHELALWHDNNAIIADSV